MSEGLKRDYLIGEEIGRGRFGAVFRCYSLDSGEIFAVKSVDKSLLADVVDRDCAEREAKITQLAAAGNPSVVQIHTVYEDEAAIHLVMDLCSGGDLFDRIASGKGAPTEETEAAAVMAALMEALAVCHRRGVAHRDVKPDNVLFDGEGRLRLADFGSAECFGDGRQMRGIVGTPHYVAPEVVAGREYGEKVDVWSAGVVLYIMLGGIPPFNGETATEIFEAVLRGNLRFPTRVFDGVSPLAKELIRRMICKDISRRFSAEQVLKLTTILILSLDISSCCRHGPSPILCPDCRRLPLLRMLPIICSGDDGLETRGVDRVEIPKSGDDGMETRGNLVVGSPAWKINEKPRRRLA